MSTADFAGSGRSPRREPDPAGYSRAADDGYGDSADSDRYGLRSGNRGGAPGPQDRGGRGDSYGRSGNAGQAAGSLGDRYGRGRGEPSWDDDGGYGRQDRAGNGRSGRRADATQQSYDRPSRGSGPGGAGRGSAGRGSATRSSAPPSGAAQSSGRYGRQRADESAYGASYDGAGYDKAGYDGAGRRSAARPAGQGGRTASAPAGRSGRSGGDDFDAFYDSGNGSSRRDGYGAGTGYLGDAYDRRDADGFGGRPDGDGPGGPRRGPGRRNGDRPGGRRPGRRGAQTSGGDGEGPKGKRVKRKGDWWRHWTWKKAVAVAAAACGGVVVIVAILIAVAYNSTPIPTDVSAMAMQSASTVYFSDGKTAIGTFGTTDRQVLSYNQIPKPLINAVLAAEDRNFYNEGGVSPTGILRAAVDDLTSSSSQLQGGSTITQQFVRNYFANIGTQQTISRKMKEIFVSVKLARVKSKAWILTQYLNTIYFGDGAYGVGAAAETFFGKPASQLDVAQDAMIASMLNAPGQFNPVPGQPGYQPLVARWHYVLQGMVTMGNLSAATASSETFPKVVSTHPAESGWTGYNGYIMQAVLNELHDVYHYSKPQIDNDGLHIVTTFSKPMMDELYATVAQQEKDMANAGPGDALPWYAHVGAVLEQPSTGAIVAMYSGPSYSEPAKQCVHIDCQDDMALENREQVGSSFKPYVLAAARAQGMNVKTSVLDGTSPLCVPSDAYPDVLSVPATNGTTCPSTPYGWHMFSNDEGDGATGPQTVADATAESLNTAYTDLTHRVGTQNVINMAKSFGVNTADYPKGSNLQADKGEVGIALGQNALTVGEQANLFATLANNGEYNTPHVIKQITQGTAVVASRVSHHEVLTEAENSDVDYALSFDTTGVGTGTNAQMSDGRPVIAKTGTTSTAQSAFFIGAIPQYSLAVGIFTNNQNASTAANAETLNSLGGLGGYGGDWPALIWHSFAEKEFLNLPVENFATPDFGGTTWNLMGTTQQQPKKHTPSPKPSNTPSPHPSSSCVPGSSMCGPTTPPPSSPPPTSPPPTTPPPCKGSIRCGPGHHHHSHPSASQGGSNGGGSSGTGTSYRVPVADLNGTTRAGAR